MREMKFEARVQPGQKLKTAEEIIKDRKEEQEKKIREMKERMKAADSDEENDEHIESVEKLPQQKAEVSWKLELSPIEHIYL